MAHDKDYAYSLNRGLFNVFRERYVKQLFDHIKEVVMDAETIPEDQTELIAWICKFTDKAVNDDRFKMQLVKQILKSIKNAPPLKEDRLYDNRNK